MGRYTRRSHFLTIEAIFGKKQGNLPSPQVCLAGSVSIEDPEPYVKKHHVIREYIRIVLKVEAVRTRT
jgi:hypothetical protein